MKRLFLDTNILLDIFLAREPSYTHSAKVFQLIENKKFRGYLSAASFPTLFYLLRKNINSETALKVLLKLRTVVEVSPVDEKVIDLDLTADFCNYEDAIQYYSVLAAHCDFLITRNKQDFTNSQIPVMTAEKFLPLLKLKSWS